MNCFHRVYTYNTDLYIHANNNNNINQINAISKAPEIYDNMVSLREVVIIFHRFHSSKNYINYTRNYIYIYIHISVRILLNVICFEYIQKR